MTVARPPGIPMAAVLAALLAGVGGGGTPGSAGAQEMNRWALIVGINDYEAYEDVAAGDLLGAVNDAEAVYEVLVERWGFQRDHVRLLTDARATGAAIREGFDDWLLPRVRAGDLVVFYFAGHGSQVWDLDGDEEDGLDEAIAPHDVLTTSMERDITDDVLAQWMASLATADVVAILDSCHSGTGTRVFTDRMRPRFIQRDIPPPPGHPAARAGAARGPLPGDEAPGDPAGPPPSPASMDLGRGADVELAAAAPGQTAMDVVFPASPGEEAFVGGAFTTHLVRELWNAPPGTSYEALFDATVRGLKAARFTQDPQRIGGDQAAVFGVAAGEALGWQPGDEVGVRPGAPGEAVLEAGSRRLIRPETLYRTREGALLRVLRAGVRESLAAVVAGSVTAPTGASPVGFPVDEPVLGVAVAGVGPGDEAALAGLAGALPSIRVEEDPSEADLVLRRELGTLLLRAPDGGLRETLGEGPADPELLGEALAREVAAAWLAKLVNPAASFQVSVRHEGPAEGFQVGDPLQLEVTSEIRGHLTVVDLGTDGTVTLLYPNRFVGDSPIGAGGTVRLPTSEMPFRLRAAEPAGRGVIRAFVTPEPLGIDLGPDPLRSDPAGRDLAVALVEALRSVLEVDVGAGEVPLIRSDGWSVGAVGYRVR